MPIFFNDTLTAQEARISLENMDKKLEAIESSLQLVAGAADQLAEQFQAARVELQMEDARLKRNLKILSWIYGASVLLTAAILIWGHRI